MHFVCKSEIGKSVTFNKQQTTQIPQILNVVQLRWIVLARVLVNPPHTHTLLSRSTSSAFLWVNKCNVLCGNWWLSGQHLFPSTFSNSHQWEGHDFFLSAAMFSSQLDIRKKTMAPVARNESLQGAWWPKRNTFQLTHLAKIYISAS